jgi:hypothetical protein
MHDDDDRNVAGLMLFLLGGLAGAALALRWSRRGDGSFTSKVQSLHAAIEDTVKTVESSVSYLRRVSAPVHDLLDEANALAAGIQRTVDSYRHIGDGSAHTPEPAGYVPSMAPETRSGIGPS